ncbi:MAG: helix-turn-helix domain-containing protein [Actinobacteria bacterium]|nr:helix-turn-helix domain-containing protein [Actinomycetota bacterium]
MTSPSGPTIAGGVLRRPWSSVTTDVVDALRERLPAASDATIAAIRIEVPSYAEFGSGRIAQVVRRGVENALERWIALLGTSDDALDSGSRRLYSQIGAGEWRTGRSMEALLAAYRTGARVAWEQMSAAAVEAGASAADIVSLAEAIFVYIDELSGASAAGYAEAQIADAGRLQSLRARLLRLIVEGAGGGEAAQALASEADWPLPQQVAVALVTSEPGVRWPPLAVGSALLVADRGEARLAVIPPQVEWSSLGVPGVAVTVGVRAALEDAGESLRTAERLLGLRESGSLLVTPSRGAQERSAGGVVAADEHLLQLAASADPLVIRHLRGRLFAPILETVSPARVPQLLETLQAWLVTGGDRAACAAWLNVHPQTVSYRVSGLRAALGAALDDPRRRQEMIVVLAAGPAAEA